MSLCPKKLQDQIEARLVQKARPISSRTHASFLKPLGSMVFFLCGALFECFFVSLDLNISLVLWWLCPFTMLFYRSALLLRSCDLTWDCQIAHPRRLHQMR